MLQVAIMHTLIPIESPLFLSGSELDEQPAWAMIFGNRNPLVLEIGCGIGDFVVAMATRHPELNFIALDFYNKGCLKSCKRAERAELTNVRIVRDEARSFIRRCLAPASLQAVFINCPDPWPKRYQRKRRLVNQEFISFLEPYLQPGAILHFATDFDDYGIDVANLLRRQPGFENLLAPDHWRHDLEGYPRTKYMLKFMAEGKEIYFVQYRRRTAE
ncbi:tRNA (guanine-N(7)-)-methyltransferase [Trichlorobacter lovleyi SZ]|jgi:tRNA (guanine-N(7)-)-methyltransferase (EC 2.1.1.33)|uniref:tRNA (guanine-N(7)-)-methyltransferase n=2 Tax=Trichlorobacter lovleyi TaxID=313985 RepID=B3E844_TRIL1|nr:tRNA (guanine-N(7)-)-methyltransferase [Trichlorobacter lovleyi SZ]